MQTSVEFHFSHIDGSASEVAKEVGAALVTLTFRDAEAKDHFIVTSRGMFTAIYNESIARWSVRQVNDVQFTFDWTA